MSKVNIPLRGQFKTVMLLDVKICTTRPHPMAKVGDTFDAFGHTFEILSVEKVPLAFVADNRWRQEGFLSRDGFIQVWSQIHPLKGYVPTWEVTLHTFKRVGS